MAQIIWIHSFRGGTGEIQHYCQPGNVTGRTGRRVGVVDTDIQSPGIHIVFGLDKAE